MYFTDILQGIPDQKSVVVYLLSLLEALPHEIMEVKSIAAISELETEVDFFCLLGLFGV